MEQCTIHSFPQFQECLPNVFCDCNLIYFLTFPISNVFGILNLS